MKQFLLASMLLFVCSAGCSICCGPFDNDYGTFGGKHFRADRSYGRVGSILSDPAITLSGASADSNLTPPPEPANTTIDDDDTLDIDLDRDEDDDLLDEDSEAMDLEPIEPLKGEAAGDSTASSRWRPRPLR